MMTAPARPASPFARACAALLLLALSCSAASAQEANTDGKTPPGLAPGSPAGSYALSGFESVNLFNGGLNFSLPLLKVGGRGAAGYAVPLRVEQKWRVMVFARPREGDPVEYTPVGTWWGGLAPGYGPGVVEGRRAGSGHPSEPQFCGSPSEGFYERTLTRLTFTAADGTEYELHDELTGGAPALAGDVPCDVAGKDRGKVFVTADRRSATFISDAPITDYKYSPVGEHDQLAPSGYLLLADGSRYRVSAGLLAWMRDRNGNKLSFAYDLYSRVSSVTDSLGRQVTFTYAGQTGNGTAYDLISFKGVAQQARTVKVWRAPLSTLLRQTRTTDSATTKTYAALFPWLTKASTLTHFNPGRASAVELPDGRRYELRYNEYGELARVALPTGGAFEYDWADCSEGGEGLIYRRVAERRVYRDAAALESRTTYSTEASEEVQVRTYDAGGALLSLTKHFFHGTGYDSAAGGWDAVAYPAAKTGRERRTESYELVGATETLRRAVEQTWARPDGAAECSQTPPASLFCPAPREPVVVTTLTTLTDTNQVSKQTSVNPQTGAYAFDQYGNRTDTWEYDYGAGAAGALLRRTHTDFLTTNPVGGADYASASPTINSPHLRGLPARESVYDAAGVEQSRAAYEYDNYAQGVAHRAPLVARAGITGLCTTFDAAGVCANADPPAYKTRGNVTAVTRHLLSNGAVTGSVAAHSQYDVAGNLVKAVDARGNVSQIGYTDAYSDGQARSTFAFPTSTTSPVPDPAGTHGSTTALVTTSVYDFWTGLPTSMTDANGQVTALSYADALGAVDKLDRLRKVVRPGGMAAGGGGQTIYEYGDTTGNLFVRARASLDASRSTDSYQYFDGLGRPFRSMGYENQDAAKPWITVDTEYDALGRVRRTSLPYRAAAGAALFSTDKWTETTYDMLGRVRTVTTRPDGAVVTTSYSGNRVTVTDQAGKTRRSVTDALGRLVRVDEPNTSGALDVSNNPAQPTHYAYDALGNLRKVDQGGQLRFFMYDSLGRLVRAKNPEQSANASITGTDTVTNNAQWALSYSYDAAGNLTSKTDARGVTATYAYDALGRAKTVTYSDATPDVARYYDGATLGKGRTWRSEAAGVARMTVSAYDAPGRPKAYSQQFWVNGAWGASFGVTYAYDLAGNVKSQTYPSGRGVSYTYDAAGRPAASSGNLGDGVARAYSAGMIYDETGGWSREQFGTRTPLYNKRFYNERGQLSEVRLGTYHATSQSWWNRGAILNVYSATAGWTESGPDNNGNLRKQMIYIPHGDNPTGGDGWTEIAQFFGYDALNRLQSIEEKVGSTVSFNQVFTYDRWGNRKIDAALTTGPVGEKQFTVNTATNRLGVPTGQAGVMTYDSAGNLTNDTYSGAGTRAYDAEGRMTSAQFVSGHLQTATYAYDADGRRVKRDAGAAAEVWQVYSAGGELLAEYAAGAAPSAPQKEYGYRAGELLVTAEAATGGGQPHDAVSGFSATQNPAGAWAYGYRPASGGSFTAYAATPSLYGAGAKTWAQSATSCCPMVTKNATGADYTYSGAPSITQPPDLLNLHPGPAGERSVVRWTAPASGSYVVSGRFQGIDTVGTTTDVQVTHNGAALFSGSVTGYGAQAPFAASFTAAAGDTLEFSVGRGANSTYSNDSTGLAASVAAAGAVGAARWLVADHLGSPRMVVDQAGSLAGVVRHDYLPFGEELFAGTGGRTTQRGYSQFDGARQRFTGLERDEETGLDFAEARYYSSSQGRFTSVDPLTASARVVNPQTWNRYTYVVNNPLKYIDPTGLLSQIPQPAPTPTPPPASPTEPEQEPNPVVTIFNFLFGDYYEDPGDAGSASQFFRDPLALLINPGTVGAAHEVGIADTNLVSGILRGATPESLGVASGTRLVITPTVYEELLRTDGVTKEGLDAALSNARIELREVTGSALGGAMRELRPLFNEGALSPDIGKAASQFSDYFILAEAKATGLPIFTNNPGDFNVVARGGGKLAERVGVPILETKVTPKTLPRLSDVVKRAVRKVL